MKKTILYFICMVILTCSVMALGVTRSISGGSVTLTITGVAGRYGGIITETLPAGYAPTGVSSQSLGVEGSASGKLTGQKYELAFAASTTPSTITYGISGTGSGDISGTYVFDSDTGGQSGSVSGNTHLGNIVCVALAEICDSVDNDCDGQIDEGVVISCMNYQTCTMQSGCAACAAAPSESCDTKDNDCDGTVDEGCTGTGNEDETTTPPVDYMKIVYIIGGIFVLMIFANMFRPR